MYADRSEAGRALAAELGSYRDQDPVVLALPRGGVPVAFEVAATLAAPLDLVLVRKIGAPWQPELAVAAVVDGGAPEIVRNDEIIALLRVDDAYIAREAERQLTEIERRRALWLGERPRATLRERTVIVVDDGIATGATMRAALRAVRRASPRQVVLAVPVAPPDTLAALRGEVDAVVCPLVPEIMGAIGAFYRDFHQLGDEEVRVLLEQAAAEEEQRE